MLVSINLHELNEATLLKWEKWLQDGQAICHFIFPSGATLQD
jgi:hypothetical protein